MISIVDYGLGNTSAIANIYKRLNIEVTLAQTVEALRRSERIILPGVGSFDWAMQLLEHTGMRRVLDDLVIVERRPVLGICIGMQIMARSSEEGQETGLGWIDAKVKRLAAAPSLILPHMGWNDIEPRERSALLKGLGTDSRFYFLHSYHFVPRNDEVTIATAEYGQPFTCAVHSGNVFGVQFHPEKSHGWGIQLLRNFAEA